MAKRLNGIIVDAEAPMDRNSLWVNGTEGGISVFGNDGWKSIASTDGVSKKYVDDQLNGYTDLIPVTGRKLTGDEAHLLGIKNSESDDYIAIENSAGSGEKKLILRYPVEDGRFDNTDRAVFWLTEQYMLVDHSGNEVAFVSYNANVFEGGLLIPLNTNAKNSEGYDGLDDYAEVVIPDNSLFVFYTGRVMSADQTAGNVEYLQDSGSIEITEEIEHGRVLREEDVAVTREANLLGFIKNNATLKSYMTLSSVLEGETKNWFEEYAAYMQNYGPMSVYSEFMTTAEAIDALLVSEDTVSAEQYFKSFISGSQMYNTGGYPAEFLHFPSLVCIGKTGAQERWVCTQLFETNGNYLAVYDAKPKLTQVAASTLQDVSL